MNLSRPPGCYATPYTMLWTLSAPAVTNFRASTDFYYGYSWDIGEGAAGATRTTLFLS